MTRVKKAQNALKYRRNLLKMTKGFRHGRKSKERMAQDAIFHAGSHAFAHRRDKKGVARRAWNVSINAALRAGTDFTYSTFIKALKTKNIEVDRKIMAHLAEFHPEAFTRFVAKVK
jgi:large subunit ribosomal protein L20